MKNVFFPILNTLYNYNNNKEKKIINTFIFVILIYNYIY